jgi:cyclic beta-1,2-glucan synthetase
VSAPIAVHFLAVAGSLMRRPDSIAPGETVTETMMIGWATSRAAARALASTVSTDSLEPRALALERTWTVRLDALTVHTPEPAIDVLVNRWLLYQVISARLFGRVGFYQAGGAYGFRDQLQDVMALVHADPALYREHLLRAAAHQFEEGDVQHWWHPPGNRGVRTRCSDDRLFLPYAVAHYVETTGDTAVLDAPVTYFKAPPLDASEHDRYFAPDTGASASLFDHCVRAINASLTLGAHDLPLIGDGDWNDGMNEVGAAGRGESVWLGWFLIATIDAFAPIAISRARASVVQRWRSVSARIARGLERHGWDGEWYRRAFFDDGTALGTAGASNCRIDSLAQSWAVFAGGVTARSRIGMQSAARLLPEPVSGVIRLLHPPFRDASPWPGYIAGYPAGVRENGAQYTHAAVWFAWAMLELDADHGYALLQAINPVVRTATPAGAQQYGGEPYVVAADVYSEPPYRGRAGWTWYTGSASWLYRAYVEGLLGLRRVPTGLVVRPRIPSHWPGFEATVRVQSTLINLRVTRGEHAALIVDGEHVDIDTVIGMNTSTGIRDAHRVIGRDEAGTESASAVKQTSSSTEPPGAPE